MKEKSPKTVDKVSGKQADVSGRGFIPPSYGVNFVDWQSNSNDATVQGVFESSSGEIFSANHPAQQQKENKTGLPENLKEGIENISGFSMDDVKVHYNSPKPAQLDAHAYAQGTNIHLASGQEKHLPHEAWHIVQQKQGRVKPTMQMKGKVNVNDDARLEKEADMMGARALYLRNVRQHTRDSLSGRREKMPALTLQHSVQMMPRNDSKDVVQLIRINKQNVNDEVWQVYKGLGEEAKLLLIGNEDFNEFFVLSPEQQINFLYALDHSTTVVNSLLQSSSRAITGPSQKLPSLPELQLRFLELNPLFLRNLLNVTQGKVGTFRLSDTESLSVANFSSISSPDPVKALLGPQEQAVSNTLVKQSQFPISSVMKQKDLPSFLMAQHVFQKSMTSMENLKSIGFEFEFASFTRSDGVYSEVEIIPSHQLMGISAVGGNFFGLSWRLESDAKNTLELVSPPFVFSRDKLGEEKSWSVRKDAEKAAQEVVTKMSVEKGTIPQTADALAKYGIGFNWKIGTPYEDFKVTSNKKSQGRIYSQQNESMYPHEIGSLMVKKFEEEYVVASPSAAVAADPVNVAKLVRNSFLAGLPNLASDTVKQAVAVFARYASNVLAIPSLRHRQVTGVRKDTVATDVKETLGIWVKTDPLNILKPLLKDLVDLEVFHSTLKKTKQNILQIFAAAGQKMVNDVKLPPLPDPTIQEIAQQMSVLIQGGAKKDKNTMDLAKQQLIAQRPARHDPSVAVTGYVQEMLQEINAFITRALKVDEHQETNPTLTTSKFLEETFGTGEGVRKGTFIKGVPTSKGRMYVTELR